VAATLLILTYKVATTGKLGLNRGTPAQKRSDFAQNSENCNLIIVDRPFLHYPPFPGPAPFKLGKTFHIEQNTLAHTLLHIELFPPYRN
jgi:hypothetical protein